MKKQKPSTVLDTAKSSLILAAKKFKTEPHLITPAQFWSLNPPVSEWDVRKSGGIANIQAVYWPKEVATKFEPQKQKLDLSDYPLKVPKLEGFKVHEQPIQHLFKAAGLKDDGVFRVVVQPDTHVPEHDVRAVTAFCEFLDWYKPHGLVNLGDFLEMEAVAHWPAINSAKPRRLVPDIKVGKDVLAMIGDAAGRQCKHKWMLEGNHEYWLKGYLNEKVPEMFDSLEELDIRIDLDSLLGLKSFGYSLIPINEILGIGTANFIHGYYTSTHHAAKHLSVFGCNIYYGHLHDVQSHSGVSVRGLHEAMSLGCLRGLDAPFLKGKPHNWVHAFGIFEFRSDGSYTRYVPIIIDGKFSFAGHVFSA